MADGRPRQPPPPQQPAPPQQAAAPNNAARNAQFANPLYVRAPPQYKSGSNLELYLQRFRAYARAVNCPDNEQADLLVSLLDDKALSGVSRLINEGGFDLDDLIAQLRRAEGYNQNSEKYVTELRNRRRLRNEDIWEYYLELDRLASRAYPNDRAMREGSLRESFIANIQDAYIASRLRELQELDMERLLDAAIMLVLHGCQTASAKSVNNVHGYFDADPPATDNVNKKLDDLAWRLDHLDLTINQTAQMNNVQQQQNPPPVATSNNPNTYNYTGQRRSFHEQNNLSANSQQQTWNNHQPPANWKPNHERGTWVYIPNNPNDRPNPKPRHQQNYFKNQPYRHPGPTNYQHHARNYNNHNPRFQVNRNYKPTPRQYYNNNYQRNNPQPNRPPEAWMQEVIRKIRTLDTSSNTNTPTAHDLNSRRPQ